MTFPSQTSHFFFHFGTFGNPQLTSMNRAYTSAPKNSPSRTPPVPSARRNLPAKEPAADDPLLYSKPSSKATSRSPKSPWLAWHTKIPSSSWPVPGRRRAPCSSQSTIVGERERTCAPARGDWENDAGQECHSAKIRDERPWLVRIDFKLPSFIVSAGMTPRSILFGPSILPDTHDFKPERWLAQEGQLKSDLDRYFVAFGKGVRMCQGMKLADSLSLFSFLFS